MLNWMETIGRKCASLFSEPPLTSNNPEGLHAFSLESLSHELPYEAFDEELGIFLNTQSAGFVIEALPLVGIDEQFNSILNNMMQEYGLDGASIQCLLLADHRIEPFLKGWGKTKNNQAIFTELANQRKAFFSENKNLSARIFRFFLSYSIPIKELEKDVILLSEIKEKILKSLCSLTSAFAWKPKDLIETVGGLLSFALKPELLRRNYSPFQNISSQLTSGGGLKILTDRLSWDNATQTQFKSFRVVDTPSEWSSGAMQCLIGDFLRNGFKIKHPFFIHYGVHYPSQEKAEKNFWRRSQLIEQQGKSGYLIRLIPELANELRECDYIRRSLHQGNKFVWTQLSCGVWGSPSTIREAEQSIRSVFKINEFNLAENTYLQLPHLLSILPMAWGEYAKDLKELDVLKTTISTECARFIPIQGEWMGTTVSPGMLLTGRRGQLLSWNPFDNKTGNYNCIVTGKSGSGKSVFMQELLMSQLKEGARVFVLDVGRSYEKMCSLIGGQQIEFSKESKICLNPFTKLKIQDQEDKETAFSFIKSIVSTMAAPTSHTSDLENVFIERAIQRAWESKGNQATITDIAFHLSQEEDERAKTLGILLNPYTKEGTKSRYFEGTNNINFSNQLVVIELEELKGRADLQSVILQLCIMTIASEAFLGDRKTPFIICIDEAWDLLRSPQTESFIETLARRLRKYRGSLVIGTQAINDFFTKPGAKAAYENSDWMCFLAQKEEAISAIAQKESSQKNENFLRALGTVHRHENEYSEVMIKNGDGQYAIARLFLDPFSNLLYSTTPKEYSKIQDLKAEGLSLVQAIQHMIKEKG